MISNELQSKMINSFEEFTGAKTIITNDHAYIHQGKFFEGVNKQSISAGGTYVYEITTPASGYVHYRNGVNATSGDKVTIGLYEGSTVAGGTALAMNNHNRNSSVVAETSVKKGVTLSVAGTLLDQVFLGGGTGVGATTSGAETNNAEHEWVLKQNTTYALQVTNDSASANIVSTSIGFYEEIFGV